MVQMRVNGLLFLLLATIGAEALAFSQIQHWITDNGARVYFVETHQIPMVQFVVGFDAGSARDPAYLKGLSNIVKDIVEEGTLSMDGDMISTSFDSVGAEYSSGSGRDIAVFELRSLSEEAILDGAIDVFGEVISQPSFPEDAMERVRQRVLIGLKRRDQSPGSVASRVFYNRLYADHPYSHSPLGEEQTVSQISRQDLVDFHEEFYVGANAVLVIVGDLSPEQVRIRAGQIVDGLPRGANPAPIPEVRGLNESVVLNVSFPSSQTHLLMGQAGIARNDPDYFPLYVGNHILGGNGLISRLATDIREERGLAYSVYSSFSPMKEPGPFIVNLQTRSDQAGLAEGLSMETVRQFVEQGPDQDELEAAKSNIIGGFPLRVSSNGKIADIVLSIAFYGLPLDHLATFSERIKDVRVDQVKGAFQRRVLPGKFLRVRVGSG